MWWVGNKACDVYIGTRAFAASRGAEVLAAQSVEGADTAVGAFATWLEQEAGAVGRLRLWLSGGLCRPMLLPPMVGLKTAEEWRQAAAAMVASHTGLQEACEVWVERRRGSEGRMAAVVPQALLGRLLDCTAKAPGRPRVARIAPWWSELLRASAQAASPPRMLAVRDCDSLTVFVGQAQDFESAMLYTPVLDDDAAHSTLSRVMMSADVAQGQERVARLTLSGTAKLTTGSALAPFTEWTT